MIELEENGRVAAAVRPRSPPQPGRDGCKLENFIEAPALFVVLMITDASNQVPCGSRLREIGHRCIRSVGRSDVPALAMRTLGGAFLRCRSLKQRSPPGGTRACWGCFHLNPSNLDGEGGAVGCRAEDSRSRHLRLNAYQATPWPSLARRGLICVLRPPRCGERASIKLSR